MPPIPEKNVVQKYQASTEFIVQRQQALNVFINRVVRNLVRSVPAACALMAERFASSKRDYSLWIELHAPHRIRTHMARERERVSCAVSSAGRVRIAIAVAVTVVCAYCRQRTQSWARATSCRCSLRPASRTGRSSRHALALLLSGPACQQLITVRATHNCAACFDCNTRQSRPSTFTQRVRPGIAPAQARLNGGGGAAGGAKKTLVGAVQMIRDLGTNAAHSFTGRSEEQGEDPEYLRVRRTGRHSTIDVPL